MDGHYSSLLQPLLTPPPSVGQAIGWEARGGGEKFTRYILKILKFLKYI
jgi:hypothetical protein